MDASDGDTGPAADGQARSPMFQLALSYANADSAYVEQVADELKRRNVSFFDPRTDVAMLGEYRPAEIARVYNTDTQHVILFISAAYVRDLDSRVEQRAAIDKALKTDGFALPARFDETLVPGLSSSIGSVDLLEDGRSMPPGEFADLVVRWLTEKDGSLRKRPVRLGWDQFDSALLHCIIIGSEAENSAGTAKLATVFKRILAGQEGENLWTAAHRPYTDQRPWGAIGNYPTATTAPRWSNGPRSPLPMPSPRTTPSTRRSD
jgi:hypothetical protein